MKYLISLAAVMGLTLTSSLVLAETATTYGPVITIKPKGVQTTPAKSRPAKGASNTVKNGQKPKTTGLILPAIQKPRHAAKPVPGSANKVKTGHKPKPAGLLLPAVQKAHSGPRDVTPGKEGTGIQGSLDRDIIRRTGTPKPKPKPKP